MNMTGWWRRRWRRAVYRLYGGFVPDGYLEHGGVPWERRRRPDPAPIAPRWVCNVVRSGYHNGPGCTDLDPHSGWDCGWRYELSLPATQANAGLLAAHGFRAAPPPARTEPAH